jgi:hypothetical protein
MLHLWQWGLLVKHMHSTLTSLVCLLNILGLTFEIPELDNAEWHSICKLVQTGCLDTSVRKEETRTSLNFQFQDDITMAVVSKNLVVMSHASGKVSLWALDSALMVSCSLCTHSCLGVQLHIFYSPPPVEV